MRSLRIGAWPRVWVVIPEEYREFFVAAAGATGALIGLLFVAISVFPEQRLESTTRAAFDARSSAALVVFTNAIVISMAALVPQVRLGWWAIMTGVGVLVFAGATARLLTVEARERRGRGWLGLINGLLIIAGFELYAGIRLVIAPELGAVRALSYVVIGAMTYGIARTWQLVGLRETGLLSSVRLLAGRDRGIGDNYDRRGNNNDESSGT